jgi:hypothetical protein
MGRLIICVFIEMAMIMDAQINKHDRTENKSKSQYSHEKQDFVPEDALQVSGDI